MPIQLSQGGYNNLQKKIRQWEVSHNRQVTPEIIQSLAEAELSASYAGSLQAEQLGLQEKQLALGSEQFEKNLALSQKSLDTQIDFNQQQLDLQNKQFLEQQQQFNEELELRKNEAESASSASMMSGAVQLGSSVLQTYMLSALVPSTATGLGVFGAGSYGAGSIMAGGAGGAAATSYGVLATDVAGGGGLLSGAAALFSNPITWVVGAGLLIGALSDSIICTELNRQGLLCQEFLNLDHIYRINCVNDKTYNGYLKLARPVVSLMKRSFCFTMLVAPFVYCFSSQAAHEVFPQVYKKKQLCWKSYN